MDPNTLHDEVVSAALRCFHHYSDTPLTNNQMEALRKAIRGNLPVAPSTIKWAQFGKPLFGYISSKELQN